MTGLPYKVHKRLAQDGIGRFGLHAGYASQCYAPQALNLDLVYKQSCSRPGLNIRNTP